MKRGKKLLTYLFTVALCLLASAFFSSENVAAEHSFRCVERDSNGQACDADTTDGYYIIDRYQVAADTTELVFPSAWNQDGFNFPVEEISGGAIVLMDGATEKLNLTKLELPTELATLNTNSLNNIASIKPSFRLPTNLRYVDDHIFDDGTEVGIIYLDHYSVIKEQPDGGIDKYEIWFKDDAFSNAKVDKIVCSKNGDYSSIVTTEMKFNGTRITAPVTYNFYSSKNSMDSSEHPFKSLVYYVGDEFNQLPTFEEEDIPNGIEHLGWWYNEETQLSLNSTVPFVVEINSYDVYPKFDMEELTFVVDLNKSVATYTGNPSIITFHAKDVQHPLTMVTGFSYTIDWYIMGEKESEKVASKTDRLSLGYVSQSGNYTCIVTYEYTYEKIKYTKQATIQKSIEILPAFLYVDVLDITSEYGTYLTDDDLVIKTNGLLVDDKIASKSFIYHKSGDIPVGVYKNELKVIVQSITNVMNEDVTSNYEIIPLYGTHTVEKKNLGSIGYNSIKEFYFGDDTTVYHLIEDDVVYNDISHDVKITFTRELGNNVRDDGYNINGIASIDNENYTATFDNTSVGEVIIKPKKVSAKIDRYSFTNIYDGEVKDVNIFYTDINGVDVSVDAEFEREDYVTGETIKAEVKNAGEYSVVIKPIEDKNYVITNVTGLNFTINRTLEIPLINPSQTFVYTGERINPIVSLKNKEQTPTFICTTSTGATGDYCKNSGIYTVVVEFDQTENYFSYSTTSGTPITLTIKQYSINLAPKKFDVYYGETPELKEEMTINGEDIIVEYTTTAKNDSPVGTYAINGANIYVKDGGYIHPNYAGKVLIEECKHKVQVVPRPLTLHFNGHTNLVYDGIEKEIGAYLFDVIDDKIVRDVDVAIVVDEGKVINAGTYHALATISDIRYEIVNDTLVEFKVEKGTVDLSKVKFESKKYVLNFKSHAIQITGNVPDDVKVRYTINGKEGNSASMGFENVVMAHFDVDLNNYNPVDGMSAVLYIDMSWLIIVIIVVLVVAGIGICGALLYASYRRDHPRKIKLKIKTLSTEDLAAKRVATSVKEVLGDEEEKQRLDEEIAYLEDENDLDDDAVDSKTFIERIYAANSELKYYYSEVKNELLSYEGISHSIDRKYEVFYHGTRPVAKLSICNGILRLYVNLDPQKYDKRQYNHKDMSKFECHEKTPLRINVNSLETLRHAKVFVRIIRKKEKLESVSGFVRIDYEKFYTLKENFIPKLFKNMFTKEDSKKSKKK